MLFLQILGGIFLVVLLVAAWYGWKILRFFKRIKSGAFSSAEDQVCSLLPSTQVELESADVNDWVSKDQLFSVENECRSLGCDHVGYFTTYQNMLTIHVSLWRFKGAALFAIYEAESSQDEESTPTFIVECAAKTSSGTLTISSNSSATVLPRPSNHIIHIVESLQPKSLLAQLKSKLAAIGKPQKIDKPKQFFCDTAEEIAAWVWSEPQLRSAEFQHFLEQAGIDTENFDLEQLVEYGNSFRSEHLTRKITQKVASNPKISAAKWEEMRDKLIIIHEDMDKPTFVGSLYDMCVGLSEAQEEMLDELEESEDKIHIFEEFEKLKKPLKEVLRVKKLGEVKEPVLAQIYLRQ